MIDAGYGFVEDGTGTCDYQPDIGQMDIGCHFPIGVSGSFGIPSSPADFNRDGIVDEWDLQLMNDCMGAIADPNIVRIDTNYDSRVNLPDFGLFAVDYGYSNDPNLPGSHDPNCERSDFNFDHRVDLADLEVLAQNWLTLVFDEYRICSLCNIGTNDPNEPNEPDTSNIIDSKDFDALMADWHKQFYSDPNISVAQSASKLSIAIGNTDLAWKISAFFDDEPIGQWISGELGSSAFDVDLTRYGPGSHRVKIVRNIGYGLEINERLITDPNSTGLYFADIPDTFEPNEPYNIRGFNLGDELNVQIRDIYDQTIYDVNVPSGAMALEISSEVFDANQICTLRLEGGGYLPEGFCILAAGESQNRPVAEIELVKEFNPTDYANGVRMAIIIPTKDIFGVRKPAIFECAKACENRGVSWVALYYHDVTKENLQFLYSKLNLRYIYWCGHANSHVGRDERAGIEGIRRTHTGCWKYEKSGWWDIINNWHQIKVLSYTRRSFPNAELLPDDWDIYGADLWALGMWEQWNKKIVFIDGCLSAAFNDLAQAYGMFSLQGQASLDQVYIGWRKKVLVAAGPMEDVVGNTTEGVRMFWEKMGNGNSVYDALSYTSTNGGIGMRRALWGENGMLDIGNPNEDDNIFCWGQGLNNKLNP